MKINYFKELEPFNLKEIFQFEFTLKSNQIELDFLIANKILILKNSKEAYFKFVGMINLSNKTIIVYPKYKKNFQILSNKERKKYVRHIFKVFEKYNRGNNYFLEKEESNSNEYFNIFSLYKDLINDYVENGLYENEKNIHTMCGDGEIDWDKTIDELDNHYNSLKNPIYTDYYTHDIEEEQENYIRNIQKNLLTKAGEYFEQFKEIGLDEVSFDFHFSGERVGDLEHKLHKIDLELRNVFSERKIFLLQLMRAILKEEIHYNQFNGNIYGTSSYHSVWENICQNVLGNNSYLRKIIPNPIWKAEKQRENFAATFVPDIVFENEEKNELHIYDAKYYETDFDDEGRCLNSKPGIGDISKQFLYEECYRLHYQKLGQEDKKYYNAFLFPSDINDIRKIGEVTFELFNNKRIELIKLSSDIMYKSYVENKKINLRESINE